MSKIKKKMSNKPNKTIQPSEPQENIYEKAFKQVDRDESGAIPLLLLNKLLKAAGEKISEDEIDAALEYMKKDKEEDSFTFEEFKKFLRIVECPERILEAFKSIDRDKNGYLDKDELYIMMSNFGGNITRTEFDSIYNSVDVNNDGKVDYKEFVKYWDTK